MSCVYVVLSYPTTIAIACSARGHEWFHEKTMFFECFWEDFWNFITIVIKIENNFLRNVFFFFFDFKIGIKEGIYFSSKEYFSKYILINNLNNMILHSFIQTNISLFTCLVPVFFFSLVFHHLCLFPPKRDIKSFVTQLNSN